MGSTTRLTPIPEVRNAQKSEMSFSQSCYFSGLLVGYRRGSATTARR